MTTRYPRNAKFERCSVSMFLDLYSKLNVIAFGTKIEHDVEKSFLTSVILLFGVRGSILDPKPFRELFF